MKCKNCGHLLFIRKGAYSTKFGITATADYEHRFTPPHSVYGAECKCANPEPEAIKIKR